MHYSDKREKTRRLILKTYAALVKGKKSVHITVKDICSRAGINRSTFYTYFCDIPELEESLVDQLITKASHKLNETINSIDDIDIDVISSVIINMLRENDNLPLYMIESANERFSTRILEIMLDALQEKGIAGNNVDMDEIGVYIRYHMAGVAALIRDKGSFDPEDIEYFVSHAAKAGTCGPFSAVKELLRN